MPRPDLKWPTGGPLPVRVQARGSLPAFQRGGGMAVASNNAAAGGIEPPDLAVRPGALFLPGRRRVGSPSTSAPLIAPRLMPDETANPALNPPTV
jgi:hypothetical protein